VTLEWCRRVVAWALERVGKPYIWSGKGRICWTPNGEKPTSFVASCDEGFDCSGLVTAAVHAAGGPDLRLHWSAQTMYDSLPPAPLGEPLRLKLYGPRHESIVHVAIEIGLFHQLEASGGDSTTDNYMAAIKRGARVAVRDAQHGRQDFRGYRSLLAMQKVTPHMNGRQ
jgi:hypothetical protein